MIHRFLASSRAAVLSVLARARRAVMALWLEVPFGVICTLRKDGQTITLKKNYWVIVSDGSSSDALPITMLGQGLVKEFAKKMRAMGYPMPAEETAEAA